MELTHKYTQKDTGVSLGSLFQQLTLTFINRYGKGVEFLARHATPYKGNRLAVSTQATQAQIVHVQQQLDKLVQRITLLSDEISAIQSSVGTGLSQSTPADQSASTNQIGINRFRAL